MSHPGVVMWRPSWPSWSPPMGPVLQLAPVGPLQLHVVDHSPQGLHNLHESRRRCLPFAGWWWGWTCHLDGIYGLWPSHTAGYHKRTSGMGPSVPAAASLLGGGRFHRLGYPGGCYFYPVQRHIITETSASVNVVNSSMASLSSCAHSTNWCGSPVIGGWAFSVQCCNTLAYARVFCGCFIW